MEKAVVNDVVNKETVEDIKLYPIVENLQRGITKETCMKFGVRAALSEKDGKTPTAYYFPSYNQKGEIIGYKKQDVTKNKDEKYHWTSVGTVAIGNKLFGQNVAEQVNRKHTNCVYTEGEWDCLSVFQAQCDSVKGTKYEGHQPFVVSIPLGTKNSVESMLHNKDFVKSFQSMTIFFDDDEATPLELKKGVMKGKEAREAVAAAFIGGIELWSVQPTNGKKDASDYMQAGQSNELAKLVQFGRKPLVTEKIVKANVLSLEDIIAKREEGIYVESFPSLMNKIHGFRKRELVLLCAPSGTGKSTVTSIFADAFVEQGEKVGMIYLEEEIKDTVQRLIASRLKVNYVKFKSDPLSCASQEQIQEAYNYIVEQDRVVLLDHFGSLPVSELMAKIKHMHFVEGCSYVLLDHLSMVISGSQLSDERKELDIVMTELAAFCASNDVCVIAVSHINRTGADQFKAPKGKENEPYWVRVTKESMRGCVDAKTEFLSQNGWKSFADYEDGDVVMQYTDKGCVEYVKPLDYINLPCDEFIHFKSNKGCDMMLSEEHRLMFATEKRKGSINFKLAKDVYDEHHNNTTGFRGIIPTTFKSNGSLTLLDESKLRVQVALNADGWVVNQNTSRCAVRVKKPRKVERMRKLLKDANMDFNEIQLSESRVEFHFTSPTGYKGVTPEWFNLTQEQLIVISDEVQYWDCDINSGRFTSINKLEADFIQFVYSATGNRSVISVVEAGENLLPMNNGSGESKMYKTQQQYRVSKSLNKFISFRKTTNSKTEVVKVESQGSRKYCFTVPSGMLLVRRNGKVFITGNSASLEQLSWTILGLEPEILPDRSRGNVRLTVLKNRTWGFLGEADEFSIDQNTWEVILATNQPTQVSSPQTVTIKPKCLDDDPELGF